jgi:hypothetical protein
MNKAYFAIISADSHIRASPYLKWSAAVKKSPQVYSEKSAMLSQLTVGTISVHVISANYMDKMKGTKDMMTISI